jgi:nitrogen fixation NifU-like protein
MQATETTTIQTKTIVGLCGKPGEGPHMILALKLANNRVVQARYSTYGCSVAETCGQWVCDEIEGKTPEYAQSLDEEKLILGTGNMPLGREHCPALAINALRNAFEKNI